MSRAPKPCGTNTAYQRHIQRGEDPDQACRDAHAAWARKAPATTVRRQALDLLAAEYPQRFREICADLVTGEPGG